MPRPIPEEFDFDDPGLVSVYDEMPFWSAPFGLALLAAARVRPGLHALDVGCGTGFPLIELAQRIGPSGHAWGLDPWKGGLARAREKLRVRDVANVTLLDGVAEQIPLQDRSIDLVVSNNGLNNVEDLDLSLRECARVARREAQLVLTWNLPETMVELYEVFESVLRAAGREDDVRRMRDHVSAKRKTVAFMRERVERAGFAVQRVELGGFPWRFADGGAFFDHFFIRLGFVPSWAEVVDEGARADVFARLRVRLDEEASTRGGLSFTVPFACLDGERR